MASGKVKWFDNKRGFGFIIDDVGMELFVHHTNIVGEGYKKLTDGEPVLFDSIAVDKGFRAQNVRRPSPPS